MSMIPQFMSMMEGFYAGTMRDRKQLLCMRNTMRDKSKNLSSDDVEWKLQERQVKVLKSILAALSCVPDLSALVNAVQQ